MYEDDFKIYPMAIEEMKLAVLADRVISDDDEVKVAELSEVAEPDSNTLWVTAAWIGTPGKSRICSVMVAGRQVVTADVPTGAMRVSRRGRRRIWLYLPTSPERLIRASEGFMRVY